MAWKIIKWGGLSVIAIIIVGIVVALLSLDGIIRSTIARQATSSLELTTTLGGAHLSIFGGELSLTDLAVDSPKGFTAPRMLELGKADIKVSYGQLRDQPVRIETITLDKPKLVLEQHDGKLNIQAISGQSSKTPTDAKGNPTQPMKVIIDKLVVSGADVSVLPGLPGLDKPIQLSIPEVDLSDVGNGGGGGGAQDGAAMKDVILKLMTAIAQKASQSDQIPPEVRAILGGNFTQVEGEAKQQADQAIDALKSGNADGAKKAVDGLKNLFDSKPKSTK